jgi:hypothetical protein
VDPDAKAPVGYKAGSLEDGEVATHFVLRFSQGIYEHANAELALC